MNRRFLSIALASALTLSLAACGSGGNEAAGGGTGPSGEPIANIAAPAGQSWSEVVRATDEGFLMGNPDAPLKLVEYGSYTCGACASFSQTSHDAMKSEFIDTGRVSFEFRPFLRNAPDLVLSAAAICAGAERFFPLTTSIFADHEGLMQQLQQGTPPPDIMQLPENQRFSAVAAAFGLDDFFAARGIPAADLNRCLADSEAMAALEQRTQTASETWEIQGTPTFLLNGQVLASTGSWDQIRERLQAAGAR